MCHPLLPPAVVLPLLRNTRTRWEVGEKPGPQQVAQGAGSHPCGHRRWPHGRQGHNQCRAWRLVGGSARGTLGGLHRPRRRPGVTSLCPEDAPPPSRVHWGRLSLSETVRGWTPRARWCGRENGPRGGSLPARPRGPGGLTLPPESRSHLHLLFSVLSMAQAPSLGPRGVSQTQESLTRDRVLSVLSGGCTPDAAPARGAPSPDASPRDPHFCPEARTFPSSMLCSWSL